MNYYIDSTGIHIRIDTDTFDKLPDLMDAASRAVSPVRAHGAITDKGAYVWFNIPLRKMPGRAHSFGNDLR